MLTERYVYQYDRENGSFRIFSLPNKGAIAGFRDVVEDAEGNLWFAGFHSGIYYYNIKENTFIEIADPKAVYLKTGATSLYADNQHKEVWIGTMGMDLYKYDVVSKK